MAQGLLNESVRRNLENGFFYGRLSSNTNTEQGTLTQESGDVRSVEGEVCGAVLVDACWPSGVVKVHRKDANASDFSGLVRPREPRARCNKY